MTRNVKKAILFIALTFSLSWLLALLFFVLGGKWNTPMASIVGVVYMFVPMTVAIVVQKVVYKEAVKKPLGIYFKLNRWFLIAWFLPLMVSCATLGISLLLPGVEYSPQMEGMFERFRTVLTPEQFNQMEAQATAFPLHPFWIGLLQGLVAGVTINAVAGFGEELGWRGLLQKELAFLGFWKSSVVIGAIWGVWHAPLIIQGHNYPQHPLLGVLMMTIWCILLAPIFSYVRLKAKSVIAAAVIHGSLNATVGLSIMVVKGGNDLIIGVTGLAGFIVLVMVNLGILVYDSLMPKDNISWEGESVDGTGK